jgi:hypothetical protein
MKKSIILYVTGRPNRTVSILVVTKYRPTSVAFQSLKFYLPQGFFVCPAWKYKRRFLETGGHRVALCKDYCGEFCV